MVLTRFKDGRVHFRNSRLNLDMVKFTEIRSGEDFIMSFDNYQCTLSDSSIKKAKEELNEDPKERAGAVQAFREWTEREPWIRAPTGTRTLRDVVLRWRFTAQSTLLWLCRTSQVAYTHFSWVSLVL